MKTKMYSSMKAIFTAAVLFFVSATAMGQFQTPNPSTPNTQAMEEVRTGSSITYNVTAGHVAGQQYRWAVIGGAIASGAAVTSGDSSIVEWTSNLSSITVNWDENLAGTPIGSFDGTIFVQKRTASNCPSQLQIIPARLWNDATADIAAADANFEICSGEAVAGNITVNLTGAPDASIDGFEVVYDITATNLTDLLGNALTAANLNVTSNGSTVDISLPAGLINTDIVNDAQFTITLTSMHDDFTGAGAILGHSTFTITVHPTVVTGPIISSSKLTRR